MNNLFIPYFFFNFVTKMITIYPYSAELAEEWDSFVRASRNGTFLFLRPYMDYHSAVFTDHSLLYRNAKGKLIAVMPCNADGDTLYSHQGLTYGGFILAPSVHASDVEELFHVTTDHLRDHGFKRWIYKSIPTIYHNIPSQEDEYFLWRNNARLVECNLSSTVDYNAQPALRAEYIRRRAHNKLAEQGFSINMNTSLCDFWPILTTHLHEKYNATPVHSLAEMELLQSRLPDNIRCCTAVDAAGDILTGVVIYEFDHVAHSQYSATTDKGLACRAQDFLYTALINHYATVPSMRYFDFGTSNENHGRTLNTSLNLFKETFGARGVTYKKYEITI